MYDIFFDLNDMHQPVEESSCHYIGDGLKATHEDEDFIWNEQLDFDFVKELAKPVNKDGCICKKCGEMYPYAEPNQPDGTMICYSCRKYG